MPSYPPVIAERCASQGKCPSCGGENQCALASLSAGTDDPHSSVDCWCMRQTHALPSRTLSTGHQVSASPGACWCQNCLINSHTAIQPQVWADAPDFYWENGRCVFTQTYHLKRGWCCGNGCRHCPYPQDDTALKTPGRLSKVRGFSLVELLVTVSIIAVLAAMLLPALSKCRNGTQAAQCTSQVRQLGLATQLYWDEHEGITFPYRMGATNEGDLYWFGWIQRGAEGEREFDARQGVLYSYVQGRGVEVCPSLKRHDPLFKSKTRGASFGYGYNLALSPTSQNPRLAITSVPNPSEVALYADAAQVNTFQAPASPDHPMLEEFYYINAREATTHFRHRGGATTVFVDGHVGRETPVPGSIDVRLPSATVGKLRSEVFLVR